jgi:hypothetical protein
MICVVLFQWSLFLQNDSWQFHCHKKIGIDEIGNHTNEMVGTEESTFLFWWKKEMGFAQNPVPIIFVCEEYVVT